MNHVFLICYPRTGGTWVGKIFDTLPNVKFLWEPDYQNFQQWNFYNEQRLHERIIRFKPHVKMAIEFPKNGEIDTAVYKLSFPFQSIYTDNMQTVAFEHIRNKLNAKVVHLTRHPLRWAASIRRWRQGLEDTRFTDGPLSNLMRWYVQKNEIFTRMYYDQDWYWPVSHERLMDNLENEVKGMFFHCGLKIGEQTRNFMNICHTFNDEKSDEEIDRHKVIMKPDTVKNRWQEMSKEVIKLGHRLAKDSILFEKIK